MDFNKIKNKNNNIFNIKKITISSLLLSLMIILSFTSNIAKVVFPGASFLHFEWVPFMVFLLYHTVGFLYGFSIIILNIAIRFIYDSADPVGVFALFLTYMILYFSYIGTYKLLKFLIENKKNNNKKHLAQDIKEQNTKLSKDIETILWNKKNLFFLSFTSVVISISFTTFLISLFNYLFIFRLYFLYLGWPLNTLNGFNEKIIPFVVPFNLANLSINAFIFLSIQPTLTILLEKYNS